MEKEKLLNVVVWLALFHVFLLECFCSLSNLLNPKMISSNSVNIMEQTFFPSLTICKVGEDKIEVGKSDSMEVILKKITSVEETFPNISYFQKLVPTFILVKTPSFRNFLNPKIYVFRG